MVVYREALLTALWLSVFFVVEIEGVVGRHVGGVLLPLADGAHTALELQQVLQISHRTYFRRTWLSPAIEAGYVELTIPDRPNSRLQKYRLTAKGRALAEKLVAKKKGGATA